MTYRYPQAHVDEMIAQVRAGGRIEPHAAVVLAAEVLALREEGTVLRKVYARLRGEVVEVLACENLVQVDRAVAKLRRWVDPEGVFP